MRQQSLCPVGLSHAHLLTKQHTRLALPPSYQTDLRPSRLALISTLVPAFIRAFFGANPLSQLGLMVARNGVAERLTDLSGAPEAHVAALAAALRMDGNGGGGGAAGGASAAPVFGGDFSLQNALDQAVASLKGIPPYGTRELLLLQSALATCDPVRGARACAREAVNAC